MNRVSGKVAIVTGAASGLGKAIAILLAREEAKVMATDLNENEGKAVVSEIIKQGGDGFFARQDVASESEWKEIVKMTTERFGKLDVLVNCAGVFLGASIEETTLEKWRWVLSINLDGVFLCTKYAAEAMRRSGGGSIVNMSSAGGIVGTPNASAYSASKGGVRLLTKAAAIEYSKANLGYNIRVNSVHPGVMETPMTAPMISDPVGGEAMLGWVPMKRFGTAEDVAYAVLYLASDESKYVTGSETVVDGGWTAQ
jgi:NAD(P)-dependent dehydrogenase (short-subunit alcohol dehydrogenase family)